MKTTAAIILFLILGASAGHAGTNQSKIPTPVIAGAFDNGNGGDATLPDDWWRSFNDPVLDSLVQLVLAENIDLKMAETRVTGARALRRRAAADLLPELDFAASAGRQRISGYTLGFPNSVIASQYVGAFEVSWEIDVFGYVRNQVHAAESEVAAIEQDQQAARLAVLLRLCRAYLTARGLEQSVEIANANKDAQERTALFTQRLVSAGALPIGDQERAEAQAKWTAAAVPALELRYEEAVEELAVLLDVTPKTAHELMNASHTQSLSLPSLPLAGVPADLLRRRPDVRAAENRVLAAFSRVGVAEADLKPRFVIGGDVGSLISTFNGPSFTRSINWLAQITGMAPLIDGGRRRSVVSLRRSEAEEARLAYLATVLDAVREVENALASVSKDGERLKLLERAAHSAAAADEQIRYSWKAGEVSILDVLEADRARFVAEAALADSDTTVRLDRAVLFAAMGG